MTMTRHAYDERAHRIFLIEKYIGMGEPVMEIPATSKKCGGRAKAILTSTGIIIVKDKNVVITAIVPAFKYVKRNFYPTTVIPWEIQCAISRNKQYAEVINAIEAL